MQDHIVGIKTFLDKRIRVDCLFLHLPFLILGEDLNLQIRQFIMNKHLIGICIKVGNVDISMPGSLWL